jgi:hypothetical protein
MATLHDIEDERRVHLAREVMRVLDAWGVEPEHRTILLGLPAGTRPRMLNRYRSGDPFPDDEALLLHAHSILAIQSAMESIFPHNVGVGGYWITTPNHFFGGKTPLDIMVIHGLEGMRRVIHQLNGTGDWC